MTGDHKRHIELGGSSNLRDIGGYPGADGRMVRWGQVYRSGALGRLCDSDWDWMIDHDIGTVCDLRSRQERVLVPTGWKGKQRTRHVGVAYEAELVFGSLRTTTGDANIGEMAHVLYKVFPEILAPSFRMMFAALVNGDTPLIVHCSAGQDRTGLAIGLVLTVLGVPRDLIYEDFLLSTDARKVANEIDHTSFAGHVETNIVARFYADLLARHGQSALVPRRLVKSNGEPILTDAFSFIDDKWGSVENYLAQELDLDFARQQRLRDLYLEQA